MARKKNLLVKKPYLVIQLTKTLYINKFKTRAPEIPIKLKTKGNIFKLKGINSMSAKVQELDETQIELPQLLLPKPTKNTCSIKPESILPTDNINKEKAILYVNS